MTNKYGETGSCRNTYPESLPSKGGGGDESGDMPLLGMRDQQLQTAKLASIGQLAAGVAHEINNPVGYVNANLCALKKYMGELFGMLDAYQRLEGELAEDNPVNKEVRALRQQLDLPFLRQDIENLLNESSQGMDRVLEIIQDLKDFAHVDQVEWQLADLHQELDSTLNIVSNELKYKAKVIKEYADDLPEIECLASQLNQVFLNLLVNAAQAITDYGNITIHTSREQSDWIVIEIRDTGVGISEQQLERIFDPFFTTKPVGKGTGLGLSLARDIVVKHGGEIRVNSKLGEGTMFQIRLPVKRPAAYTETKDDG